MDALLGKAALIPGGGVQVIGRIEERGEGEAAEGRAGGQGGALHLLSLIHI